MTYYIEHDFPIEQLNPLARREASARRDIAMLHKWWARRVGCVFRTMILASLIPEKEWRRLDEEVRRAGIDAWTALYYREHPKANPLIEKYLKDKVVLDPFMGGGTTIVEALRLGCKVIGVDVNPVAWFIVKKSIEPVDLEALDAAFEWLKEEVAPDILKYYRTVCPVQTSEVSQTSEVYQEVFHQADVMYVFWVKKVQCTNCGRNTRLFSSFRLATKKGKDTVVCPHCYWAGDVEAQTSEVSKTSEVYSVVCPDCGREFHPREGWAGGGKFTCEHCGHVDQTVEWVRRTGRAPDHEMFALEYWCPQHGRGYKGVEEFDKELYRKARRQFEKERANLPLPEGDIPAEGRSDPRPINYGMTRWTDLFNPRQLLCLGRLMRAIRGIEDQAIRELLYTVLSDACDTNNMLCTYLAPGRKIERLFGRHAYWPSDQPVENNVWGTEFGRGTFSKTFHRVRDAVKWGAHPFERVQGSSAKVFTEDPVWTPVAADGKEVVEGDGQAFLAARSSEDLSFVPLQSVDAVITDPPYYGNVQYAELSDFFYGWLRAGLKDDYPEFTPFVVPKETEIVVNKEADKTDEHFRQGLLRCFKECQRVLKDDGVMAFTFHHEEPQAWGAVLEAVLDAEFSIEAVWTYHSEKVGGAHGAGIRFDTIVVCRKRLEEPAPAAWGGLQDRIVAAVKEELRRLLDNGAALSSEDVFVITMGKALSVYSGHYPNVMHDGQQVRLTQAIEDIEALVDEQIDAYYGMVVPTWLDVLSRVYLQHLARRGVVTRDGLVKVCRTRGLDFGELEELRYIERGKRSGEYQVLLPQKRMNWLEKRLEKGYDLSPLDRAHYLYALYKAHRSLRAEIPRLYTRGLEEVTNALYRITRDRGYELITADVERLKEQGMLGF